MLTTTADVILRYFFNKPITAGIELTEFMMTVIVGLAIALTAMYKGHVNVDVISARFTQRGQAVLNSVTSLLSLGLFAMITWQLIVSAERYGAVGQTSSAWHIPIYPFIYVLALGASLVCLTISGTVFKSLSQVVKGANWWLWAGLLALIVMVIVAFTVSILHGGLLTKIDSHMAGLLGLILLVLVLFSGMSIAMGMALVGFLGITYLNSAGAGLSLLATSVETTAMSYGNSIVPLFILMGAFAVWSGMSRDLYFTVYKWIGHLPGGLAMATIGACAGFAAVCGSTVATASTLGVVCLPEMKKYGYNVRLATGCIAAGGTLGVLIPPSIGLAIYGILTEQSIGKLFIAGFLPGILQAVSYLIVIYITCKHDPLLGPRGPRTGFKEKMASLKDTWGTASLFLVVIGGLYFGVFTPTEAAGFGAFGAFIYALGKRKLPWKAFWKSLYSTGDTVGMALLILFGGVLLSYFFTITRIPFDLADMVSTLGLNNYVVIAFILIIMLVLGCFLSGLALIVLTTPIFYPVIVNMGFDPIWFGIMAVRMMEIGAITPPVGINVFVIKGIAKDVPMYTVFRGIVPFLMADIITVIILVAVPQISLFLPSLMK
jgi:tripartite ATP-independent transporter DctM subunit